MCVLNRPRLFLGLFRIACKCVKDVKVIKRSTWVMNYWFVTPTRRQAMMPTLCFVPWILCIVSLGVKVSEIEEAFGWGRFALGLWSKLCIYRYHELRGLDLARREAYFHVDASPKAGDPFFEKRGRNPCGISRLRDGFIATTLTRPALVLTGSNAIFNPDHAQC